jgi:uncharacterized RDD family membrane protein YckC
MDTTKKYPTYWKRWTSLAIDAAVFIFLTKYLVSSFSPTHAYDDAEIVKTALSGAITYLSIFIMLQVIIPAIAGRTIGMAILSLKFTALNGTNISIIQAIRRRIIEVIILVTSIVWFRLRGSTPEYLEDAISNIYVIGWFTRIFQWYLYSEWLVFPFNEQRRAIQDFMAGTIVVDSRLAGEGISAVKAAN